MDVNKIGGAYSIAASYEEINKTAANKKPVKKDDIKTDKIAISNEAKNASIVDIVAAKVKADIVKESKIPSGDVPVEKLSHLREKIRNNELFVPANLIADAIMSGVSND